MWELILLPCNTPPDEKTLQKKNSAHVVGVGPDASALFPK